jgi:hypothetical protein
MAMMLISIGTSIAKFGEKKTGSAAVYDLIDVLVAPALVIGLLYWGGFFG